MSRQGLSRPSELVQRSAVISHDRWIGGRSTGTIDLVLATLPDRFVSPGTGRLVLAEHGGGEIVAQQAARSKDRPIIPGSGIKGAVRTLYELLSASCNPFDFTHGCKGALACDACSLFGLRGWTGRVAFSDAVPLAPDAVRREVRLVPTPWEPDGSKTNGEFRLYDLATETGPGRGQAPELPPYAREVYSGSFTTRLSFTNATDDELGRLALCLGLGGAASFGFPIRLGGVKYAGQGAVQVAVKHLSLRWPVRTEFDAQESGARVSSWITTALSGPWGETFTSTLREMVTALSGDGRQP